MFLPSLWDLVRRFGEKPSVKTLGYFRERAFSGYMFNVVLVEPEIPPNTGNIGRLCLATRATLHLVKPLGFSLEDRELRRAGLDYWNEVSVGLWDSFEALQKAQSPGARYFFLTTKSERPYYSVNFQENDFLVFGRETKGLPEQLLSANACNCITIPMDGTRSLNLATAVAVVLFEAVRQSRVLSANVSDREYCRAAV